MSGIFGTFHRDRQPPDLNLWKRLGNITAHRGPDGTTIRTSESVLLGHNALHTTAESLHEELPCFCQINGLAITADARIDNRSELLQALDMQERTVPPVSDSRIILLAYAKWGEESFQRLLGDFSFVLWDSVEKKILCVRDSLGVRPFYYFLSDKFFAFSSEIKPLSMHPHISERLNEGMIGEHLSTRFVSKTETLFQDILRLAPAHYMTITAAATRIRQYWKPNLQHRLRYPIESDYIEHFQEIFSKAISCRLRSQRPVSIELSGGLDSSSIVGMACALSPPVNKDPFLFCSLSYPGLACDERKYVESVRKHLDISVQYINATRPSNPDLQKQAYQEITLPDAPNLSTCEPLLEWVRQNNSRVLLSGIGGDEWFSGSDYIFLDLLLEQKYTEFSQAVKEAFRTNYRKTVTQLAVNLTWPLLPCSARTAIIHRKRRYSLYPPWISSAFAKKINLDERILRGFAEPYVANLAQAASFELFHSGYESNVLEKNDAQKSRYQIEQRHPFLDRRIIEFALALPNSRHQHNGIKKRLLRLAGKNYLPAIIQKRHDKAEFSQLYSHTFNSELFASTLNNSAIYATGWMDKQILRKAYTSNLHCFRENPSGPCSNTLPIWFAYAITKWYDNLSQKMDI